MDFTIITHATRTIFLKSIVGYNSISEHKINILYISLSHTLCYIYLVQLSEIWVSIDSL